MYFLLEQLNHHVVREACRADADRNEKHIRLCRKIMGASLRSIQPWYVYGMLGLGLSGRVLSEILKSAVFVLKSLVVLVVYSEDTVVPKMHREAHRGFKQCFWLARQDRCCFSESVFNWHPHWYTQPEHLVFNIRVLLEFEQPTFQTLTDLQCCSAAWSAFHLTNVVIRFVSGEIMKWRLLKCLLDHPLNVDDPGGEVGRSGRAPQVPGQRPSAGPRRTPRSRARQTRRVWSPPASCGVFKDSGNL